MQRYDPYNPDAVRLPYPFYANLRVMDPVHWGIAGEIDRAGTWYFFAYPDVIAALRDARLGREVAGATVVATTPDEQLLHTLMQSWMIVRDPPTHTRLRALVHRAFTPRMIDRIVPRITELTDDLLAAKATAGRIDIMADFARPLPILVIAEMLGVPPEDYPLFLPWSLDLAAVIDLRQNDQVRARGAAAMRNMVQYLRDIVTERRRTPREDLISALIASNEDGTTLSEDELIGSVILLLTAGNDPVALMVGNYMLALLDHPELLVHLRAAPELIEPAADELLRYDTAVQMTFRYALTDVEYGGKRIAAGDHVALVFGSALRDPAYTADPDVIDVQRPQARVPYGMGIHFCLGAALSRAQGQAALATVVRHMHDLAPVSADRPYQIAAAVRGPTTLPVTFRFA